MRWLLVASPAVSLLVFAPAQALGPQYKASQDAQTGVITVAEASAWMPIQLVTPEQPDKKTLQSYGDAQVRCGHRYARIRDLPRYPYALAACVTEQMHIEPGSLVKVIPLPDQQYKDRH
ncbi:MAG: hypothetical protein JWN66_2047 [Sphingomonas bacterium]|jgi:hypothetical protein|uniref:hypothetical protein n=1 Tax=Sphingomonas bacterium TaxID=1895847 RepID=UPI00261DA5FE|nr:hypothetical protein [Sphingomonas bacterium]MDB5704931.1 hypothetical protein [Sphingomonas bacterium]